MRRVTLVVALAVAMAAMIALTVGSALAKDTQPKPETYIDKVVAEQYFAQGPSAANQFVGTGMFRGDATDIEGDGDPGLTGMMDARIIYSGGSPGPGVENTIEGGSWMLCSEGFKSLPLDTTVFPPTPIPPECNADSAGSAIALQGNVSSGTAEWDTDGNYANVLTPGGPISVYAGVARVECVFTVTPGGTVNGVPVTEEGTGTFEGTLDHRPLLDGEPPILEGELELKF